MGSGSWRKTVAAKGTRSECSGCDRDLGQFRLSRLGLVVKATLNCAPKSLRNFPRPKNRNLETHKNVSNGP